MKRSRVRDNGGKERAVKGPRVLVVIDQGKDLSRHCDLLRSLGYEVSACDSYARGLAILQSETFDLVTVGQGGGTFEGRKVVARALELDRSTPVLVLARNSDMKNYMEAMQLGAVDYLEMPVPTEELARVLRTHVRYQPAA